MLDQRLLRLLPFSACLITLLVLGFILYGPSVSTLHLVDLVPSWLQFSPETETAPTDALPDDPHPIVQLMRTADAEFDTFLSKETFDVREAARRYRERRGRHPPPGFDKWWKYATENNATMVEDFWDQIYHDWNPMWALNQTDMLDMVRGHDRIYQLRNGKVTYEEQHFWMPIWADLIEEIGEWLPDMDIAINVMDEPRLLIPWEDMKEYVAKELEGRKVVEHGAVKSSFSAFKEAEPNTTYPEYPWNGSQPIWPRAASVCPPDSPARQAALQTDFSQPPILSTVNTLPHTTSGFVSNYTLSTSVCHQPDIQGLHGFFIEGLSASTGPKLFPLFGSSKILQNSEILIPPAMYYKGDDRFKTDAPLLPWTDKRSSLVWRGLASGGRNKENNWKGFHRHRLVSMLNGTQALMMPNSSNFVDIESLPLEEYHLKSWENSSLPKNEAMGKWLNSFTDVGLNDLFCFPRSAPPPDGLDCPYTSYLFEPSSHLTLEEQHHAKYLVDIDGNSFSGRYRDFLRSGSLPIKATLFREWHDSRLVVWKHFVPMDNRFLDIYGIMEFFVGYEDPKSDGKGTADNQVFENPHAKQGQEQQQEPELAKEEVQSSPDRAESRLRLKPRAPKSEHLNAIYTPNHDALAKKIALEGRDWAAKVLRIEDMRIYTFRLLLEYARVMDPRRDVLGWVEDEVMGGGD